MEIRRTAWGIEYRQKHTPEPKLDPDVFPGDMRIVNPWDNDDDETEEDEYAGE